jgi:DHA1 family multidrug resistance protein-like MFS transporter
LISEVVSPDSRGLAMGGYNTAIYFGMMLSSLVMGMVIRAIGFKYSFFIVAIINLATTGVFYLMFSNQQVCTDNFVDLPSRPSE